MVQNKSKKMAKEYPTITITVPDNIDYEKLFEKIPFHLDNPTEKKIKKVRESIYLFLSYLYPTKKYDRRYQANSYWKPILMEDFRYITRYLEVIVINILSDPEYPIIDINPSYIPKSKPKSYRLRFEFWYKGCPPKIINITSVISQNYLEKVIPKPMDYNDNNKNSSFEYLFNAYKNDVLSLDPKVHFFIQEYQKHLKSKLSTIKSPIKKKCFEFKIDGKLNKLRNHVKNIEEGNFNAIIKKNNRRLYSELTYCNKEIRKYLKINNNDVCEVDIKNSHLYILASMLNKDFILTNDKNFSLFRIDNKIYNSFNSNHSISNKLLKFNLFKNHYLINNNIKHNDYTMLLYMSRIFDNVDVKSFQNLPFEKGIYHHLNNSLYQGQQNIPYIKKNVMFFLNMKKFRNHNDLVCRMRSQFPTVDETVKIYNGYNKDNKNLSVLLQRVESYLLLEVGVKNVLSKYSDIKFLSVHDSIVVEKKFGEEVKSMLENSITEVTGIPIGLDIKPTHDPLDSMDEIVDDAWSKISASYLKAQRKKRDLKQKKLSSVRLKCSQNQFSKIVRSVLLK